MGELAALRKLNLFPERLSEAELKKLDNNIKRNTAITKRLRAITVESYVPLCEDLVKVNLARYVDEAACAISDGRIRRADIHAVVEVCSLLHQRYADFASKLEPALRRGISQEAGIDCESTKSYYAQRRVKLFLFMDLIMVGVLSDVYELVATVEELCSTILQKADNTDAPSELSIVAPFAKYFSSFARKQGMESCEPCLHMPDKATSRLQQCFKSCANWAKSALPIEYQKFQKAEADTQKKLLAIGELTEAHHVAYGKIKRSFEQLHYNSACLAEALGYEMPVLTRQTKSKLDTESTPSHTPTQTSPADEREPLWEDDDTRIFYENLVDLRTTVPKVLLQEKAVEDVPRNQSGEDDGESNRTSDSFKHMLRRLSICTSRELADAFATDFCYSNSSLNRQHLLRALLIPTTQDLSLIPYFARIAATLATVQSHFLAAIVDELEMRVTKNVTNCETDTSTVDIYSTRFLAELTKFGVVPPKRIFHILKACLDNLSFQRIDIASHVLESCGRFLCRAATTSHWANSMVDIYMRAKSAKGMNSIQIAMMENALRQCRPLCNTHPSQPQCGHLEQYYLKHLISFALNRKTAEDVGRQIRRLPWAIREAFLLETITAVCQTSYTQIAAVATLVRYLNRYHDKLGVQLVDRLLEKLRGGLASENMTTGQQVIAYVHLLCELYHEKVAEADVVLSALDEVLSMETPHHGCVSSNLSLRYTVALSILCECDSCFKIVGLRNQTHRVLEKMCAMTKGSATISSISVNEYWRFVSENCSEHCSSCPFCKRQFEERCQHEKHFDTASICWKNQALSSEFDVQHTSTVTKKKACCINDGESVDADEVASLLCADTTSEVGSVEFSQQLHCTLKEASISARNPQQSLKQAIKHDSLSSLLNVKQENIFPKRNISRETYSSSETVSFKLLSRRGGEQMSRQIGIPSSSDMVCNMREQQEQELAERRELKRLVLQLNTDREGDDKSKQELRMPYSMRQFHEYLDGPPHSHTCIGEHAILFSNLMSKKGKK
mmetsp:Transcript_7552/g.26578  ORF Transcript_7552/g.26578 Transcript_7552/m.26578 type:complete len:1015 (+) Transcript_7552:277-3321(+)|eukprot:CAMPEP_0183791788 /NCGR_PEP_ID=MMETSP0803_2-20130417/2108_1 /TAXON_ID=195967 /ORGANISM="Crustomastix stigmata, Strain CCMP3273" /LENGTH=1014 /DNA_ID=CAMNT_0026036121 /DNA_START=223 /DNA_END=3267 /DNA_ORIENTATION=-